MIGRRLLLFLKTLLRRLLDMEELLEVTTEVHQRVEE